MRPLASQPVVALLALTLSCSATRSSTQAADASSPDAVAPVDIPAADDAPALSDSPVARRERCNGVDDDLDGRIDEGCPIRLTFDPGSDGDDTLQGGRLVSSNGRVTWMRTLPEGPRQRLPFYCPWPALWGELLACAGDGEYLVHDLVTGTVTRVAPIDPGGVGYPRLRETILAWSQYAPGGDGENEEVYAHDLATGVTTRITNDPAISVYPRIEGHTIAWTDDRFGHHRIFLEHQFDVFTRTLGSGRPEQPLTHRAGDLQIGTLMGFDRGRLLLTEYMQPWIAAPPPARCQPVLYDAVTGARTELSPLAERCDHAGALSGNRVAVEFDPEGASDIYLIDATTHARRAVTNYPRRSLNPLLDGDNLVWSDDRNDNMDLYYMDLTDAERGDFSPEGVTP